MNIHRTAFAALIVGALWSAAPNGAGAQGGVSDFIRTNPKFLHVFREVVAGPSESTVRVRCDGKDTALGVIVDADGWVLTKAFDLHGKITCRLKDGRELDATIIGVHQAHDLAMLKVESTGLPAVRFSPSKGVPAGSWVASVSPDADPVAVGVISVPTRNLVYKGLPIAASELSKIGYLGVALEPAGGTGVRVIQVIPDTPAAKAGLHNADIILKVSGQRVNNPEEFQMEMAKRRAGDRVTLHVRRDREELSFEATLQQRPKMDARGELQNNMGSTLSARRSGYPTILTHDSVVAPQLCGGPLVDLDGHVLGINISRAGRTETWAIPTEVIVGLLAELKSGKLAPVAATAAPMPLVPGPTVEPAQRPGPKRGPDDGEGRP